LIRPLRLLLYCAGFDVVSGLALGVADWSVLAFLCFFVFFLGLVSPEAPELFTPDVSVALGLLEPVALLPVPAEEPDEPEVPDAPDELSLAPDDPPDIPLPPVEDPEEPEVPEEPDDLSGIAPEEPLEVLAPPEAPDVLLSLGDFIVEDDLSEDPVEPADPVCASAIEDTDATNTNDNDRIVVFKVMSHS
jgi:hypothetical protein